MYFKSITKTGIFTGIMISAMFACKYNSDTVIADKKLPNIVLIVSDDQGYNDIGIYGSPDIKTPNLDQLAKDGARFTSFYVTCSGCTPSRGSLLTGRYPLRNGTYALFRNDRVDDKHVYSQGEYSISPERIGGMDLREILLPELLKNAGYKTGIFGKWDLGQLKRFLPLQRGFDDYYGFPNTGIDYYTHERYFIPSMYRNNEPTTEDKGIYSTYLFEREALRFLKENKEKPFFLYLPFNAPHGASNWEVSGAQAPPEFVNMYPEAKKESDSLRINYMAAVTCMDCAIGNVLKLTDSFNLTENTLVIFLSDNGGVRPGIMADNSPLRGGKGTVNEGGHRVPCIIKWPAKIPKGQKIDNFVSSLEIFPTILYITGIEKPDSVILDGFNIMPLLTGENPELERKEMYWIKKSRGIHAARVGNWKWVKTDKEDGLYDLSEDIAESNNLGDIKINEYNMVKKRYLNWIKEMAEAEPRGPFRDY